MTRPAILDLDLVVVPREAMQAMLREIQLVDGFSERALVARYTAMLSASPYPTAWDDVRKAYGELERRLATCEADRIDRIEQCDRMANDWADFCALVGVPWGTHEAVAHEINTCAEAAEARIAKLEADHLEERLAMSGRIEFLEDASAVPHLEQRIAELEKRLADAGSEPVGTDAEGILRQAIKRAEKVCKSDGGYMPALATLVRILADELADAYPDDTNGGRAALKEMGE